MTASISLTVNKSPEIKRIYVYKIDHDLGTNPNPFGNYCTLAHCKGYMRDSISNYVNEQKRINPKSTVSDLGIWVIGIAGKNLNYDGIDRYGRIVYIMQVTELHTYNEYWNDQRLRYKKSIFNDDELLKSELKNYQFYKENANYLVCGDNQKDIYDYNSKSVPYKHILLSDRFEYYGTDSHKNIKLLDYLGLKETDKFRGHRRYPSDNYPSIPPEIMEFIKNTFKGRKCLSRPTFSSPDFKIPKRV